MAVGQEGGARLGWGEWLQRIETVAMRTLAVVLLVFALEYWMRLTGFWSGPEYRFDTMSDHWRAASASLAVLFPVAALGLWGRFSWGLVVWFLAAGEETLMHLWFADLYGRADWIVAFHLATLVILASLRLAVKLAGRRA